MEQHNGNDLIRTPEGKVLTRRAFLALGLGAAALAACAPATTTTTTTPGAGASTGTAPAGAATAKAAAPAKPLAANINFGAASITSTLDPHGTLSQVNFHAARPVYDALITFDRQADGFTPQLASEWRRIDPLTFEFKLRDDVKFHNGESMTAEVVKMNLDRVLNSEEAAHRDIRGRLGAINAAEVVNSTTIRIKSQVPDPLMLNRLTMLFILAPELAKDTTSATMKAIGSGAFRVSNFETGKRVQFEAWDGSWRGKPKMQTASITAIPEGATLVSALKTGEMDVLYNPPTDQVAGLERDGFQIAQVSSGATTIISFKQQNHPLLRDRRVREALNYAVNKDELLQTIGGGFGKVVTGQLIEQGMLGYQESIQAIPYDPERARSLLRQANATDDELLLITNPDHRAIVQAVVGYMNAVGFKARGDFAERAIMTQAISQATDRPMLGWSANYFHLRDYDASAFRFSAEAAQTHFENAEFHRLYDQSRVEVDETRRRELIGQMSRIMHDEHGALWLLWRSFPFVHSNKVKNFELTYDTSWDSLTVEKEA